MPVEQRYTPVPGMERPGSSYQPQMSEMGRSASADRLSGMGYDTPTFDGPYPTNRHSAYSDTGNSMSGLNEAHRMDSSTSFLKAAAPAGTAGGMAAGGVPQMAERNSLAYQNVPSEQYWPESHSAPPFEPSGATAAAKRKRIMKIGAIVFGVLAVIAIVVGVVVSQVTKNNKSSGGNSGSGSGSSSGNNGTVSDPSNPSNFEKDSRLHQSFWAMAYTPQGSLPPACGADLANITRDIQILSQLTTRLRLYGANCNDTALVLQAIEDTKVDMSIWPAIYIDSNESANKAQKDAVIDAIRTYGTKHINGVIVGNEYILNAATTDSNTSAIYLSAVNDITTHINEFNTSLQALNLDKNIPIGTSDAGSILSTTLSENIDFFMANVHPWFGTQPIQEAAGWTNWFFQNFDVDVAATAANKPACYIAETGWPTESMTTDEANNGAPSPAGDASLANLQTFLDTFVCQANANGTEYFFFEAFDEPWKAQYGGVEPYWGMFDKDRNLKELTIPTC